MKNLFTFICLMISLGSLPLNAQCYQDFFKRGKQAYDELQFEVAIAQFKAAQVCPGITQDQRLEIVTWITEAQNGYIKAIKKLQEEAIEARKIAEKNAEIAEQRSVITEANRIAFLADQELERKNYDDAMALAFMAYNMVKDTFIPKIINTFGDAVYWKYHQQLKENGRNILGGTLSPDGSRVITYADDHSATVWGNDGEIIATLESSDSPVYSVALAPIGGEAVTGSTDQTARIWKDNGTPLATLEGHNGEVTGISFAVNGEQIITWSRDGTARLWNREGNSLAELIGHKAAVLEAVFSPDGKHILTRSADWSVRIWYANGQAKGQPLQHTGYIYRASFSPDGQSILTASADGSAKLWSLSGEVLANFTGPNGPVTNAAFSPDGQLILTTGTGGELLLYQPDGKMIANVKAHNRPVVDAAFGGTHFFTQPESGPIKIWDYSGRPVAILDGQPGKVLQTRFSPNGRFLLSAYDDGNTALWNLRGNIMMDFLGEPELPMSVVFSKDGNWLMSIQKGRMATVSPIPAYIFERLNEEGFPAMSAEKMERYGIQN
ncbi:WD40 repeat domain-containing protein [Flavilitoribacter nigricans]|uniref:Uncharacterized protein n=1 Tax=Flavilitoribacter nigricans (strain ATCC 23147 / DSM 23189 / NBRC 102662 / NCIMB 1420 / SS-2) TaxID=1122177 RepID=A0A2D0MZL7_FLAN2|nr:WD40 repeat domain-containing protein [Flavilitoribacter nigricans]PHN00893.1 hypothetical protein CRP01_39835 [Flavilitoribacter nigricans DSM 23189 = NBRC 102662]